ncbi:MAG: thermonuclease family protein [Polaromonas sp.]|nr:thermonuclease family protein [Polaromonas sp.]
MSDLVYGKTVTIPDIKIDRYSRTVSRAMLGNMDAGLEQINAGMAWHFKKYQ